MSLVSTTLPNNTPPKGIHLFNELILEIVNGESKTISLSLLKKETDLRNNSQSCLFPPEDCISKNAGRPVLSCHSNILSHNSNLPWKCKFSVIPGRLPLK